MTSKIERDSLRFKTIADFLTPSDAKKGDAVTITGGAFAGWSGTVADTDGIWRTVECKRNCQGL